ncbi:MAG: hypothetical protein ACRYG7_12900 [Janthinobacterium lividum]
MSYRRDLKRVRRARKLAKRQQRQLAQLELLGITAVTLHTTTGRLTIAIERQTGSPLVDTLRESLRDRRRALQAEARQLRQVWQANERLSAPTASAGETPLP